MTIKTISLAGAPGREYLWRRVRKELLEEIEPLLNTALRVEFPEMGSQISELDRQTEFILCQLLIKETLMKDDWEL